VFLSGLEIFGFKSFPKRTKLTFEPGVMSIVGPNGCGKTNIVDAVRWVLGEQRTSILRSEKMENVIFSGVNGRKPMNMAEITLVIENSSGVLPAEYTEVAVTRKLYRNGESEYSINKRPVRLKDIRSLFADTGLGPDSYSIIELSMVEGILSGKPEERRKLFEEAAGVTMYKSRLRAARNKFTATEADLIRLEDLLREVVSQRNSLQRHVRRVKRYRFLLEALRARELISAREEINDLRSRMAPLEERIARDSAAKSENEKKLAKLEEELARERGKLGHLEEKVTTSRQEKADSEARFQMAEREIATLEERIRSGRIRKVEREREEGELGERRIEISKSIERLHKEKSRAEIRTDEIRVRLEGMNEAWKNFRIKQTELLDQKENLEDQRREADRKVAGLESESARARDRIENINKRIDFLDNEKIDAINPADLEKLSGELKTSSEKLQKLENNEKDALGKLEDVKLEISQAKSDQAVAGSELEAVNRRISLLEGLVQGGEGRPEVVKELMNSDINGIIGRLGDAIDVTEEFRPAVEAALEEAASAIVTNNELSLKEAAKYLIAVEKGRGTVVSLEKKLQKDFKPTIEGKKGVLGSLSQLVKVKGESGKAASAILEHVWLVENIEALLEYAPAAMSSNLTLVSRDGCRLTPEGLLSAGKSEFSDLGAIPLLEETKKEKVLISDRLANLESRLEELNEMLKSLNSEKEGLRSRKLEATRLFEDKRGEFARLEAELAAYKTQKQHRINEMNQLNKELVDQKKKDENLSVDVKKARVLVEERSDSISDLQAGLRNLEDEGKSLGTARDRLHGEQVEASSALERLKGEVRRQGTLLEELGFRQTQLEKEYQDSVGAQEDAAERLRRIKAEAAVLKQEINELSNQLDKIEKDYNNTRNSYAEKNSIIDALRTDLAQVTSRQHAAELELSDMKHRLTTVRDTIIENYQIDLMTAAQEELPLAVDEDNPYLEKTLSELREGLRDIGPVNQMAVEEFEVVDRRFRSLSEQQKDLVSAKETLMETIEEINDVARRKFLETFGRVEGHFVTLFAKLFGGGEAELTLGDGDPLEAGIRIYASPKGKRLTSIDLLSGGEKAMTAIALLFSLYLERPAPFCFLDEVDAPLDDVNVLRFNSLLREFTNRTQFIVVTHNKLTMEHADRLYGVTMEVEGISQMVSVQLPERSPDKSGEED